MADGHGAGINLTVVEGTVVFAAEESAAAAHLGVWIVSSGALGNAQVLHRAAFNPTEQSLVTEAGVALPVDSTAGELSLPIEPQVSQGVAATVESALEGSALKFPATAICISADGEPLQAAEVNVVDEFEETFIAAVLDGNDVVEAGIGRDLRMEGAVAETIVAAVSVVDDPAQAVELRCIFDDEGVGFVEVEFEGDGLKGVAVESGAEMDDTHGVGADGGGAAVGDGDAAVAVAVEVHPGEACGAATQGEIVVGRCPGLAVAKQHGHDGDVGQG